MGVILRQTCFLGIGPARPGRIFGPSRPGPGEFSAQVGPARRNFRPKSARPGGIFGPSRPGPEKFSAKSARPGPARRNFQTESARPGPARSKMAEISNTGRVTSGATLVPHFQGGAAIRFQKGLPIRYKLRDLGLLIRYKCSYLVQTSSFGVANKVQIAKSCCTLSLHSPVLWLIY